MIYRLSFEERKVTYVSDTETKQQVAKNEYASLATAEADKKVMAGMLRALADKLDPPKTTTYRD